MMNRKKPKIGIDLVPVCYDSFQLYFDRNKNKYKGMVSYNNPEGKDVYVFLNEELVVEDEG